MGFTAKKIKADNINNGAMKSMFVSGLISSQPQPSPYECPLPHSFIET